MVSATVAFDHAGDGDDVARASASSIGCWPRPRKARIFETRNCSIFWPTPRQRLHRRADLQPSRFDPARQDAAEVGVGAERGRQHPEILAVALLLRGRGTWCDDQVESAERSLRGPSSSASAQPARPEA